jgi:hypothetical protein
MLTKLKRWELDMAQKAVEHCNQHNFGLAKCYEIAKRWIVKRRKTKAQRGAKR